MDKSNWALAAMGGAAVFVAPAIAQEVTASAGAEYTSGAYGGEGDTDVFYVPLSIGVESDKWWAKVSVPWLSISGPGTFLGEDISLVRDVRMPNRGTDDEVTGLGDVSLSFGRGFILDTEGDWQFDLTGRIKFATADEQDGLSTGETDYTFAADLTRNFDEWSLFGGGGYRIIGDPTGRELNDTLFTSVGGVRYLESGNSIGGALDFNQAATAGTDDALEVSSWMSMKLNEKARLQIYGLAGLTDGGPDYGAGLRLTFRL